VGALRTVARRLAPALVVVAAVTGACTGSSSDDTEEGARPIPAPVEVRQEPDGVTLADPAFEALPGARAEFGRLGGAVYQLEVPERWNERLVLWMHGFEEFGPEASVSAPDIRAYLIAHGYAWGASSLSGTGWIPGREADETAAVWDLFTERHGRPDRTYVVGLSMGGATRSGSTARWRCAARPAPRPGCRTPSTCSSRARWPPGSPRRSTTPPGPAT
jgi:hypothetical protein